MAKQLQAKETKYFCANPPCNKLVAYAGEYCSVKCERDSEESLKDLD